jgi:hypothetical protein
LPDEAAMALGARFLNDATAAIVFDRHVRHFMGFARHASFASASAQALGKPARGHFLFLMMFWFVGAATAAIALPLWFVSEVGALLRWCFNREWDTKMVARDEDNKLGAVRKKALPILALAALSFAIAGLIALWLLIVAGLSALWSLVIAGLAALWSLLIALMRR